VLHLSRSDFPFNMNRYVLKDHLTSLYQRTQSRPTTVINPSMREHIGSTSPNTSTQNRSDNETVNSTSRPKTYTNYIYQSTSQYFPFLICAQPLFCPLCLRTSYTCSSSQFSRSFLCPNKTR